MNLTELAVCSRAVNLARGRQIRSVDTLMELLKRDCCSIETISQTILHWADYEQRKPT